MGTYNSPVGIVIFFPSAVKMIFRIRASASGPKYLFERLRLDS